jgi:hypothetical protein
MTLFPGVVPHFDEANQTPEQGIDVNCQGADQSCPQCAKPTILHHNEKTCNFLT